MLPTSQVNGGEPSSAFVVRFKDMRISVDRRRIMLISTSRALKRLSIVVSRFLAKL